MLAINEAQTISPLVSCTHRVKFSDELGGLDGPIGWPCCWDGFKPTCGCLLVQEGLVPSCGNPGGWSSALPFRVTAQLAGPEAVQWAKGNTAPWLGTKAKRVVSLTSAGNLGGNAPAFTFPDTSSGGYWFHPYFKRNRQVSHG